jgi:hypothetical protein
MKLTKKFKDFLSGSSKETPEVKNNKDILPIILDFFKTSEKLVDYVDFDEQYEPLRSPGTITSLSSFSNLKLDYYKFKYNKDVVANLKDRLSDVFVVNGAHIYIGLSIEHGIIEYILDLDISDTGLDEHQFVKYNSSSSDDVYYMNNSNFNLLSYITIEGDIEDFLNKDLIGYVRWFGFKWDFYSGSSEKFLLKLEYEKRVKEIQSKIDDVKDILIDLIDLSSEHNIIKNQAGGISAFIAIPSLVTTNISQGDGYSIELNKTSTDIFDILLEARPRILDLIGDNCNINVEFGLGKINLFINAKREH